MLCNIIFTVVIVINIIACIVTHIVILLVGVVAGPSVKGGPLRCAHVDTAHTQRVLAYAGREIDLTLHDLDTNKTTFHAKNVIYFIFIFFFLKKKRKLTNNFILMMWVSCQILL